MRYKTNKKDFEVFKEECNKWVDYYGLKSWIIDYTHSNKYHNNLATCNTNITNRSCVINLTINWETDQVTDYWVRRWAFHEVCELFLANLRALAFYRHTTEDEIKEEVHAIIRTLENELWEKSNSCSCRKQERK